MGVYPYLPVGRWEFLFWPAMVTGLEDVASEQANLRVVANSGGVGFFIKENASEFRDQINALAQSGVRFLICNNTLQKLEMKRSDLLEVPDVIPSGIVEVVRLQNEGFAYVKP